MAQLLTGTRIYGTGTVDTQLFVNGTNLATSTTTGALQVVGGLGVGGAGYFGGNVNAPTFIGNLTGIATTATLALNANTATNLAGGATGSLPYQSTTGTTAMLSLSTSGYILTAGATAPQWTSTSSLSVGSATNADNVKTVLQTASASYYPTFVDANNSTSAYEALYTTSSLTINPSTGDIVVGRYVTASRYIGTLSQAYLDVGGTNVTLNGDANDYLTYVRASNYWQFVIGATERLRIDSSGTVGIGFTAPNGKLDVAGDLYVGATQNTARFKSDGTDTFVDSIPVAGGVVIRTGGSVERLRVTANGGLAFGGASNYGVVGQVLQSNGDAAPTWTAISGLSAGNATTATNLAGGTAGQVPYQTAPGVTSFYGPGTAGNVLVSNGTGAPTYNNTLTLTGTTAATSTTTGALQVVGGFGLGGDLFIRGDIATNDTTFNLINATATTVNFAGAATALNVGATSGSTNVRNNLTVSGNLTVQGTTTIVDSTVTNVADPILTLGGGASNAAPTVDDNKDRGIAFKWMNNGGTTSTGFFGYDDSTGYFTYIQTATIANEVVSGTKGAIDANIAGGSAQALVYQSAADTTAFLPAGTSGYVLQTNGTGAAPSWVAASGIGAGSATYADNIRTIAQTASATYYPTFVDSNNSSNAYELVYTTSTFTINAATGAVAIGGAVSISSGNNTITTPTWEKFKLVTTGVTAAARQGSDGNGLNFTSNALYNAGWIEDDATKKKFAYIQHLGNSRHEFRTAAAGSGISWITGLTLDDNAGTFNVPLTITATTASVSTSTGALIVNGGVGIAGTLFVGALRADSSTSATTWTVNYNPVTKELTTATAGSTTSASGTGTTSTFVINNSTSATSTNTGALQVVNGGAGIGGSLYVGGTIYSGGNPVSPLASTTQEIIATAGQTSFTLTAGYIVGYVQVFANGILLNTGDYTATNGTTVVVVEPRKAGDVMRFVAPVTYVVNSGSNAITAGQVSVVAQTASATYYPTFVDSNNATSQYELVYTTSSFSVNPATGLVTIAAPAGGDGVPALRITQGTAPGTFNWASSILNSSLSGGKNLINIVGQAESGNNSAYFGFKYVGASNALNFATIGLYGADNLLNVLANGNVGVGTTSPGQLVEAYKSANADVTIQISNDNAGTSATAQFFANNGTTKTQFFHTGVSYSGTGVLASAPGLGGIYNTTAQGLALIAANAAGVIKFATGSSNTERLRITVNGGIAFGGAANYGTSGYVLKSNGDAAPTWVDPATLTASATTSTYLATTYQTASGTYYPTFVDSNNSSIAYEAHYTTSTFTINPATGVVGINGVGGTALNITVPSTVTDRYFINATAAVNSFSIYDNANTPYINSYAGMTFRANQIGGSGGLINFTGGNVYVANSLGVGTNSPGTKLHVYESGAADVAIKITPANGSYDALLQMTGQDGNIATEGFEIWYSNTVGDVHLSTTYPNDAASIHFHTRTGASKSTSTERLTILGGGNVGIGQTSPTAKLDVSGTIRTEFYGTDTSSPADVMNITGNGVARALGTGAGLTFTAPANTDGSNMWAQARIIGGGDNSSNGDANGALTFQTRSLYNPGGGGSWNWRTVMTLRASGAVSFGNGGTSVGTSGYILKSNGNAAPTWVDPSTVGASVSLTNTYIGYGSASNTVTGSSSLTWSGSQLYVSGTNTSSVPLLALRATGTGTFQRGVQLFNTSLGVGDSIMYALGTADSSRQMGQMYYVYAGSNSTSNRLSFGLHSVDDVLNITGAANVGIGTTTPGQKLSVNGSFSSVGYTNLGGEVYISPTNTNTLNSGYSNAADGSDLWINYRGYNDTQTYFRNFNIGDGKGTNILWADGPNKRISINNGQSASYTLDVNGTGRFTGILTVAIPNSSGSGDNNVATQFSQDYSGWSTMFAGSSGSANGWGIFWAGNQSAAYGTNGTGGPGNIWSNSTNPNELVFVGNGRTDWTLQLYDGRVWQRGAFYCAGDVYSSYSDLRLKTVLGKIERAVDKVQAIETFYYEANETALELGASKGRKIGVSAQSVKEVVPEVVNTSPLSEEYMTVQYERLVPLLIEATKEQQTMIELLQKELAELKSKLGVE